MLLVLCRLGAPSAAKETAAKRFRKDTQDRKWRWLLAAFCCIALASPGTFTFFTGPGVTSHPGLPSGGVVAQSVRVRDGGFEASGFKALPKFAQLFQYLVVDDEGFVPIANFMIELYIQSADFDNLFKQVVVYVGNAIEAHVTSHLAAVVPIPMHGR